MVLISALVTWNVLDLVNYSAIVFTFSFISRRITEQDIPFLLVIRGGIGHGEMYIRSYFVLLVCKSELVGSAAEIA